MTSDFEKILIELINGNRRVSKFDKVAKHGKKVDLICRKCGRSIAPGSFIYRNRSAGAYGSKTFHYHLACWLECFI